MRAECLRTIATGNGTRRYYSLPALADLGFPGVRRMPISLRIVLESLLRNCDGERVTESQVAELAGWQPNAERHSEIPFTVGRIVLQDVAGIPLLCDLAAMRSAVARQGRSPDIVRPRIPVDMVIDHSVEVDFHDSPGAIVKNARLEMQRNEERFRFVKWAMQAIEGVRLIPSGFGILHQVNLEFLARGLLHDDGVCYPDTLVGTDSHSGMIAGLGVVGWGVGGIEAESAMLGQPVNFLTPDVTAVNLRGELRAGVTSTDLVLYLTHALREAQVVGQFVEFIGDGVARLSVPDRATVANMAPEYGATIGFFPMDEQGLKYLAETGRPAGDIADLRRYFELQDCFGDPARAGTEYTRRIDVDLADIVPSLAGPKRPQDRVDMADMQPHFHAILAKDVDGGGYGRTAPSLRGSENAEGAHGLPLGRLPQDRLPLGRLPQDRLPTYRACDGDVLIAAITSCTNTSNPSVMIAAGLLAKAAVERGLSSKPWVKTSLSPGSLVVSRYLDAAGLQPALDALGFRTVGYGCMTCIGSSGPLADDVSHALRDSGVVACAVLSGNRNFEARIHPALRAAYLASPPLVVAYALAGTVDIDMARDPLGHDAHGRPVFLADLWPTAEAIDSAMSQAIRPAFFREVYEDELARGNPLWNALPGIDGALYPWDDISTYIKEPPYFKDPELARSVLNNIRDARALAILGDSVTTDHISPINRITQDSAAGRYLQACGVAPDAFSNYGARRMNHEVMVRGGFGNVRLRNAMVPGVEGPWTIHYPSAERMPLFDAASRYHESDTPLIVFAGDEYGTGSARDWAAKATRLLGVRAVVANGFERIHRSNLVGMGVLPCQLPHDRNLASLALDGSEVFTVSGLSDDVEPRAPLVLGILRRDGRQEHVPLVLRLDTRAEIEYAKRGGILPYVMDKL
jgi:aconitate hydratase